MPTQDPEFIRFLKANPSYPSTEIVDKLRATEYARLDLSEHIYLDYTGGGLYAESQIRKHHQMLGENVYGNPHSTNPTSLAATHLIEHTRAYILNFFNANPDEYLAIFTANASGALKLVGESYPFPNGRYLLTFDNHNSVNGIREFAHTRRADVTYIPIGLPEMRWRGLRKTDTTFLLIPRNPTSRPCNIHSNGLKRPMPTAGMYSSTQRRMSPPAN